MTTLFEVSDDIYFDGTTTGNSEFYDVAPDDQRFLMAREYAAADDAKIILVQNFFEELKRLVPN